MLLYCKKRTYVMPFICAIWPREGGNSRTCASYLNLLSIIEKLKTDYWLTRTLWHQTWSTSKCMRQFEQRRNPRNERTARLRVARNVLHVMVWSARKAVWEISHFGALKRLHEMYSLVCEDLLSFLLYFLKMMQKCVIAWFLLQSEVSLLPKEGRETKLFYGTKMAVI